MGQFSGTYISRRVAYMEGIKYVNLIEIGQVVTEIRGVENGELAVPVNITLVHHTAFLATDTQPCVLIMVLGTSAFHSGHHKILGGGM